MNKNNKKIRKIKMMIWWKFHSVNRRIRGKFITKK